MSEPGFSPFLTYEQREKPYTVVNEPIGREAAVLSSDWHQFSLSLRQESSPSTWDDLTGNAGVFWEYNQGE